MELGNASYNKLYTTDEKHYENSADKIDLDNRNNSLSLVVDEVEPNSRVLDVGCSFGYIGEWLSTNRQCTLYGIDIDSFALSKVKEKGFYRDAYEINFDSLKDNPEELSRFQALTEEFDYIICADVLEHLKNPTEALKLLAEKLKAHGKIIVSIPNISNMDIVLSLLEEKFNYSDKGLLDNTHEKFYTRKSFAEWIYTINNSLREYHFDLNEVGVTTHRTKLASTLKSRYPLLYSMFYDANPRLEVFQNIFALKKLPREEAVTGLNNIIKSYKTSTISVYNGYNSGRVSSKISRGNEYSFELEVKNKKLKSLGFLFGTHGKAVKGALTFTIKAPGGKEVLVRKKIDALHISDNQFYDIDFASLYLKEDTIKVTVASDLREEEGISLYLNEEGMPYTRIIYYEDFLMMEKAEDEYNVLKVVEEKLRELNNNSKYYRDKYTQLKSIESNQRREIENLQDKVLIEKYNKLKQENFELRKLRNRLIQNIIKE